MLTDTTFSVDNEQAVLGSVLIDPQILPMLRGIVNRSSDFFIERNRWVWEAMCSLDDKKYPIDLLTVSQELGRDLAEVGGQAYLTSLVTATPSSLNAEHYARTLHHFGVRRRMIEAGTKVANLAFQEDLEVEDVVTYSIEAVQQAANGLLGGRAQDSKSLASEFYDLVLHRSQQEKLPGIPTGFLDLDILLGGGLQEGEFTILGGFPGTGKTAVLDTVAYHVSKTYHTAIFTLEMSSLERTNRIISQQTGISTQRIRAGKLNDNEWQRFTEATGDLENHKLMIDDTAPLSISTLRAKCVQWRSQHKLDVIIVDYAGLLDGIGKTPYERACYLSRQLKLLAGETGCHVLAAQQFNREGRQKDKPNLWDFRDSGSWEQDANNAFLLYEVDITTANDFFPRRLEVAKHRNGPTGYVDLLMHKTSTKFSGVRHD